MARPRPRITLVVLSIKTNEDIRPWISLARGLIYSKSRVICNIVTHEQFAPMLADAGVGFLNGGTCPFHARGNTVEGRCLEQEARSWNKSGFVTIAPKFYEGGGLESFMNMIVRGWFEAGLNVLQDQPTCDLAILCGSTTALVYSSVCEALGVPFAIADDVPMVENSVFGPPLGFIGAELDVSPEERARQWKVHAESVWGCLFKKIVNDCRKCLIRHPWDNPHGCNATKRSTQPNRVALSNVGENDCLICAEGAESSTCRAGGALQAIDNPRGCLQQPSSVSPLGIGKFIPILLFYSPQLLERPSDWGRHVIVAGPLLDADESLRFLSHPTPLLNKTHASALSMGASSEEVDSVSSLSSGSSDQPRKQPNPVQDKADDSYSWNFPPRSNSELSGLLPNEVHRFLFQRSGSASSSSSLGSLQAITLKPTVYIDLGAGFASWSSPSSRGLVLQQCINTARTVNCRVILVADSSIVLPFNLLSQHPSVEWTQDRQALSTTRDHAHIGDLGALVRASCEDVLVLRRPIGDSTTGCSRAATMTVALLSRCSGMISTPSSWLIHAAALAGTPLVPLDFSRSDSPDSFWGTQLHNLRISPVKPLHVRESDHQKPGLSEGSLRRALETIVDPASPTRGTARELSAMTRASTADSLQCTFAEYRKQRSCAKRGAVLEKETVGILRTPVAKRNSCSASRVGGESPSDQFRCLDSAVSAVLGLALPLLRKRSQSRRPVSPSKSPPTIRASPHRLNDRYFEEEESSARGAPHNKTPQREHHGREAKF